MNENQNEYQNVFGNQPLNNHPIKQTDQNDSQNISYSQLNNYPYNQTLSNNQYINQEYTNNQYNENIYNNQNSKVLYNNATNNIDYNNNGGSLNIAETKETIYQEIPQKEDTLGSIDQNNVMKKEENDSEKNNVPFILFLFVIVMLFIIALPYITKLIK